MKHFRVDYYDFTFSDRKERFSTAAYSHSGACQMADTLSMLGCTEITVVPLYGTKSGQEEASKDGTAG